MPELRSSGLSARLSTVPEIAMDLRLAVAMLLDIVDHPEFDGVINVGRDEAEAMEIRKAI